jgi:hypothetical protein
MAALRIPRYAHIHKLAIVDDESSDAQIPEWEVEAAGFEPLLINRRFRSIEDLAVFIQAEAQGALCVHHLASYGLAHFYGAKLVATLYDLKVPALLVTQYVDIDNDVSIRRWRDKIPVLLSRDEANADSIQQGITSCVAELQGQVPSSRRSHRTLLRVINVTNESNEKVVDVIIPGWNPYRAVRFPASLLPGDLEDIVAPQIRLFALVNIGAERSDELYFREFELAEEPDDDDGLA